MSEISELNKALEPYCLKSTLDNDLGDIDSILHPHPYERKYEELDWIEVKGDNQIELRIPAKSPIKIEMKVEMTKNTKGQCLFGFSDEHQSSSYWKRMYLATSYSNDGYWCFGYGSQYLNPHNDSVSFDINTPYLLEANFETGNSYLKVNDEIKLSTTLSYNMDYDFNIPLLCRRLQNSNTGTASDSRSNAKLYYFKLWKNEDLLFDLIPVIIDDILLAFKNKVNNNILYGTDPFRTYGTK